MVLRSQACASKSLLLPQMLIQHPLCSKDRDEAVNTKDSCTVEITFGGCGVRAATGLKKDAKCWVRRSLWAQKGRRRQKWGVVLRCSTAGVSKGKVAKKKWSRLLGKEDSVPRESYAKVRQLILLAFPWDTETPPTSWLLLSKYSCLVVSGVGVPESSLTPGSAGA